jgi:hypothetical protein
MCALGESQPERVVGVEALRPGARKEYVIVVVGVAFRVANIAVPIVVHRPTREALPTRMFELFRGVAGNYLVCRPPVEN